MCGILVQSSIFSGPPGLVLIGQWFYKKSKSTVAEVFGAH